MDSLLSFDQNFQPTALAYFVAVNVVTFVVYGIDKWKAKKGPVAYLRGHPALSGCDRRQYRGVDGHVGLAPQDAAQEVQIRRASDSHCSIRAYIVFLVQSWLTIVLAFMSAILSLRRMLYFLTVPTSNT